MLAAGALVNVAIAWGFNASVVLVLTQHSVSYGRMQMRAGDEVDYAVFGQPGLELIQWDEGEAIDSRRGGNAAPPRWSWVASRYYFNPARGHADAPKLKEYAIVRTEVGTGWPSVSMRYCETIWRTAPGFGQPITHTVGFEPSWSGVDWRDRAFPLLPIWPGFIGNTLLYALALWLLLAAPFAVRRMVRRRRRRCAACGYPIGSSAVCTECGKPVGARRVGSQ